MTRTRRLCPVRVMPGRDERDGGKKKASAATRPWWLVCGENGRRAESKLCGKKTGCDPVRVAPCTLVRSDRGKGVRCRTIGPARPVAGRRTGDVHATTGMRPERTTAAPCPRRRRGEFHVTQGLMPPRAGRLPANHRYASGNRKTPGRHPECQDAGPAVVLFAIISSRRNGRPADPLHASRRRQGSAGRAGAAYMGRRRGPGSAPSFPTAG